MKKVLSIILAAVIAVSCMSFSVSAKTVKVIPTRITSVVQKDISVFKIGWKKISNVKGYVLYCSTNGRKYSKLTKTTKTHFTHKNLKNNVKYYYKIRTYKIINNSIKYSKYSNIIAKKCTNYLVNFYTPYRSVNYNVYKSGKYMNIAGMKYTNGFALGEGSTDETEYCIFNLDGKYKYLTFTVGVIDNTDESNDYDIIDNIIQIYSDNECIKTIEIRKDDLPTTLTIDIENASKLEIRKQEIPGRIGFANVRLSK